jgi:hypothetical protein
MKPEQKGPCGSCRWWERHAKPGATRGQCRRHAPVVGESGRTVWPDTSETSWCGSYRGPAAVPVEART